MKDDEEIKAVIVGFLRTLVTIGAHELRGHLTAAIVFDAKDIADMARAGVITDGN